MPFWKKKPQPKPQQEEIVDVPNNPYIAFELIDGIHLQISMAWPQDCDIKPFARFLALLNSGHIIEPQLAEATLYASKAGQSEKALVIHAELNTVMNGRKKDKMGSDKPVVPPSKVISSQIRNFNNHTNNN